MSEIIEHDAKQFPMLGNDPVILLSVLTKRVEGTCKVYCGVVRDNSMQDPEYTHEREWVKQYGNPLPESEARVIFDFDEKYAR